MLFLGFKQAAFKSLVYSVYSDDILAICSLKSKQVKELKFKTSKGMTGWRQKNREATSYIFSVMTVCKS